MSAVATHTRSAVHVTGLRKSFGEQVVLDGIDLDIAEATVFALLGPNGAGKTTTVRILSTLLPADAGDVRVAGFDLRRSPERVREAIGVTGQFSAVDNLLTGEENLLLMADLRRLDRRSGRRRAAELLERFDLTAAARKTVATYSGGMRRRLDLAMTLVARPQLVFLDEPTTGLDPRSRRTMWETVRELVADGVTILLTTQDLDEADELADRVALLDRGRVVAEGMPEELKRGLAGGHARLTFRDEPSLAAAARALGSGVRDDEALVLTVPTDDTPDALRDLLARLDGVAVERIALHTPDLDDVFLALTGAHDVELETTS
ncbi:MAG TPA: ATP-binding cassette domain-containing protein [Gaiellaceae bacterium]|nr:ATP-binding cassette domain-containing protein [Gaiellaceae bacterium]